MTAQRVRLAGAAAAVALLSGTLVVGVASRGDDGRSAGAIPRSGVPADLPLDFVRNEGQWPSKTRFAARKGPISAAFARDSIRLAAAGAEPQSLALAFDGASPRATVVGESRRAGRYNFFVGDSSRWRTGVSAFGSVLYRGLYPGVDVRVRELGTRLEYDVLVAPGADLGDVVMRADGARGLSLERDGSLALNLGGGTLRQSKPVAWQVLPDGTRRPVESRFRLLGGSSYGFAVEGRDPSLPLVVDPGLEWSTFLGGAGDETIEGIELAPDGSGDVIVAGQTWSPDFPHTSGHHRLVGGTPYVARLNATGSALVYSTFFGGSGNHAVIGLDVDADGRPVVAGDTTSEDFPTTPGAYDRTPPNGFQGDYDAFVIKFDSSGSAVVFGTYLGGAPNSGSDAAWNVGHDPAGNVIVSGVTHAADFPTTAGALDRTVSGRDVFVSRLDPSGSNLTYSTLLGGDGTDEVFGMAVDSNGFVNLVGKTSSVGAVANAFPTTGDAVDSTYDGRADGYFTRLRLDGGGAADLKYSTLLGGAQYTDAISGVAIDPNDPSLVTVSGWTRSGDFPTTPGALDRTHEMPIDSSVGVIARFSFGASSSLVWSTLLPGLGNYAEDVVVSNSSEPLIVGANGSGDPPTTERAYDRVPGDGFYSDSDGYVARLSSDGSRLGYLSLLGGSGSHETAWRLAYVGGNTIVTAGLTNSPDFPTTPGAFDNVYGADGSYSEGGNSPGGWANDAFVARFTLEAPAGGDVSAPAAPTLRGPAEGAAFVAPAWVTLDWSDVADESGIEAYHFQVSPNPQFFNDGGLAGTFSERWLPTSVALVYRSQSNTGTMYWRVQALDKANNLGPWSAVRTFTVASPTPPEQVVLESPPNGSRFAPGSVTFGWKHPSGAQYYEIQIDTRSDFSNSNKIWVRALTMNRYTATIAEGKYYWRVRASNQSLTDGPWSTVWAFEAKRGEPLAPVPPPGTSTGGATITTEPAPVTWEKMENHVTGGGSTQMTVRLASAASAGGAVVTLESQRPYIAQVPPSVTVPAGATSASFTATASSGLELNTTVAISAEYQGVVQAASLSVARDSLSPELYKLTVAGSTGGTVPIGGGTPTTGRVEFAPGWVAPPGGRIVTIASTDPDLVQVPPSVVIPAGSTFVDFTVTTQPVTQTTKVAVIAARSRDFRVTLELLPPATLASLVLDPSTVTGGSPSTGTVGLSGPAPAGGVPVALASSDTRWATVPASVTVPEGASSTTFTVTTFENTSGEGQWSSISAAAGGITKTATINVNPKLNPPPSSTDSVSVTRAEYDSGKRELRVEATSTSSSATLKVYVSSTDALIGTLSNLGSGKYGGQFSWSTNPQSITVKSSLGGSATKTVTAK